MKQISVRIEDEFYKDIRHYLIEKDISFNEYVLTLIEKDMEQSKDEMHN